MKVLMLGWEFPPFYAGGVGIVCYELTKALLTHSDVSVTYVMPYGPFERDERNGVKILFANHIKNKKLSVEGVNSFLQLYESPKSYISRLRQLLGESVEGAPDKSIKEVYGGNILEEVYLYAKRVAKLCYDKDFDVIHAHDWTTIPAAFLLKELTGKPVILHVHITEYNKTGGDNVHPHIYAIEKYGFAHADKNIAVSNMIKEMMVSKYGVSPDRVDVIHNGGVSDLQKKRTGNNFRNGNRKVLFAGRVTLQKGPEYFVRAAQLVLQHQPHTTFIFAGTGDMLGEIIQLSKDLDIYDHFRFPGFYSRQDADRYFSEADVFVMPSVSEPFGIVPLEAMSKGTPTIVSKQSGISEVLENTFKVDFWDIEEMASKIIGLLEHAPLHKEMSSRAFKEFDTFSWDSRAQQVIGVYNQVIH